MRDNWVDEVYIHYNIPGHTKFSPDRWFGIIKKYLKNKCIVEDYETLIKEIEKSSQYINYDQIMTTSKIYCDKFDKLPVIKYDFKELLDKGYKDLPIGVIQNNYCFIINKKIQELVIKPNSDTKLSSNTILRYDTFVKEINFNDMKVIEKTDISEKKINYF